MGMDTMINGRDVRLSGLFAKVAFKLYPAALNMANSEGLVEFTKGQVACIIVRLSDRLDELKIHNALTEGEIPMDRVRHMIMNLGKLYSLMDWCQDPKNDDTLLTFA
jgi:hypothetical protein